MRYNDTYFNDKIILAAFFLKLGSQFRFNHVFFQDLIDKVFRGRHV